jgi:hypothetical protein
MAAGARALDRADPGNDETGAAGKHRRRGGKAERADMAEIETASSRIKVEGARYPAFHETLVGR